MSGLSVGIACTILIVLWVVNELSFNRFLPKSDRLYQVMANVTYDGRINTWGAVTLPAYDILKTSSSHVRNTAAASWKSDHLLTVGEQRVTKFGYYATEEFLTMFEFPVSGTGNPSTMLRDPGSIVLTESTAKALFGNADPINKLVRVDDKHEQKVTGILKDIPGNSSFQFDCLLPWTLNELDPWVKASRTSWDSYSFAIYVELDQKQSESDVNLVIRDVPGTYGKAKDNVKREFFLYPMLKWRLYSVFENGRAVRGGVEYVKLFSIIAGFILLMACINFMNLATARSEKRAREVGVRKSIGSSRRALIVRFLGESIVISLASMVAAILIAEAALPAYNTMVNKKLFIDYSSPEFWLASLGLVLVTGLLSGSYPAFYLSAFKPVSVLKGKVDNRGGSTPRKVLVTLQFGFAIILVIGTLVVYQQVQYIKARDLGYDKENLITVVPSGDVRKHYDALKQELLQSGVVQAVTHSNSAVTDMNSWSFLGWPGKPETERVMFANLASEYDFTKTLGIKIIAGRDFSEDHKSDSSAIIVNKSALDLMGLKDPIGQQLTLYDGKKQELIGVMEDVIMGSPNDLVGPAFLQLSKTWYNALTIRLAKTSDLPGTLSKVESIFKKYNPAYPFEFKFVDVEFQKKYTDITLTGRLANVFAVLAIVITGLGLFGLASFTAEQRTREMGIRKVLGASVASLVSLISADFSKLVALSFLVAAPVAWWALGKFLQNYAYHINIPWWVFPLTAVTALTFSVVIVSTQAWRAAKANPATTLRTE